MIILIPCTFHAGGFDVPVILVPSLAAFSKPVPSTAILIEVQPAAAAEEHLEPSAQGAKDAPEQQSEPSAREARKTPEILSEPSAREAKATALQPKDACTPGQLPEVSSNKSAADNQKSPLAVEMKKVPPAVELEIPQDPPAPPCPSTREARRASAPAILALWAPESRAASQSTAPDTPQLAQAEQAQELTAEVERPRSDLQIEESPDAPDDKEEPEGASQQGEAGQEGEQSEAQGAPRPVSLQVRDLDILCDEPALDEPGTPTGQACTAPGAALASVSLPPPAELSKPPPAKCGGQSESPGQETADQEAPIERQQASVSPETHSLGGNSLIQTASCAAAPQPPKAGTEATAHGSSSSCASKNSRPQKNSAPPCGAPPSNRELVHPLESAPDAFPLHSAARPHQRQQGNGAFMGQTDIHGYDLHSQSGMELQAGATPVHGGSLGEHDLHSTPFAQEQCYPQQIQQMPPALSAPAEHDAFGPLLGQIFGADIGADPMAMDDDLALLDSDLASAWHHEATDIR